MWSTFKNEDGFAFSFTALMTGIIIGLLISWMVNTVHIDSNLAKK